MAVGQAGWQDEGRAALAVGPGDGGPGRSDAYPPVVVPTEDDPAALGRLVWVHHQRRVFHLWRNLATLLAATTALAVGSCAARRAG